MFDPEYNEELCPYCGKGDELYLTKYTENKVENGVVVDECFTHQTLTCRRCKAELYHWCFLYGNEKLIHISNDRDLRLDGEYCG